MENIMSWENIKDYQFSSSRYFKRDEIEKQELSLYMIDEKTLDSLFLNSNFKTLSRREFVKSFALPLLDCEYIFCDDMDEVWAFTAQFMENIAHAYMLNQEIQIENVGNSIRELIQCYDEYMNETNDNYHLYLKVKDFLLKLPTSKEETTRQKILPALGPYWIRETDRMYTYTTPIRIGGNTCSKTRNHCKATIFPYPEEQTN